MGLTNREFNRLVELQGGCVWSGEINEFVELVGKADENDEFNIKLKLLPKDIQEFVLNRTPKVEVVNDAK
jgi:hypothetical protein